VRNTLDAQAAYEACSPVGRVMRRELPDARRRLDGRWAARQHGQDADGRRPAADGREDARAGAGRRRLIPIDTIEEVGPGGHFFGTAHTQSRFRDAFYRPFLSDWRNYETWDEAGRPTADQRSHGLVDRFLAAYEAPAMDPEVKAELRAFVDRRIAEGGVATDF
jgi:hypothetical protein